MVLKCRQYYSLSYNSNSHELSFIIFRCKFIFSTFEMKLTLKIVEFTEHSNMVAEDIVRVKSYNIITKFCRKLKVILRKVGYPRNTDVFIEDEFYILKKKCSRI